MLLDAVRHFCFQFGLDKKYWVAFSGGLDSHVLLSLCKTLRTELNFNVGAIHVNHGISPHALAWETHCRKICEEYAIEYQTQTLQLHLKAGDSIEEKAREKRYAVFAEYLGENDVLLTAHQQDDQAETVLLQLLRGAGPKGLSAMPAIKPFAKGLHARPLLQFTRVDLQQYADAHQLNWINDESNDNTTLSRNFIRHEILSRLQSRWPTVSAAIARSASHCAENQVLLEEFVCELHEQVKGSHEHTLSVAKLMQLSAKQQRLILRSWIYQQNYPTPDTKKIITIQRDVFTAACDRLPSVTWGGVTLRRYRDDLYLTRSFHKPLSPLHCSWDLAQSLVLPDIGILHACNALGRGLSGKIKQVSVRYRQNGDRVELPTRGKHSLKNLFQEWGVLPWERDSIPLIFVEDYFVAAVGYFMDAHYRAEKDEMGYEIVFERM